MGYEVKLTMKGKFPSGKELFKYSVSEKVFNQIFDIVVTAEGEKKGYVII